jgi:penicillin-binding protein 1A
VVEQQVKLVIKDMKKPDGTPYDIYKDGLKITTTIDVRMQRYAEEAVQEHLTDWQKEFLSQPGYKDGSVWNRPGPIQNVLNQSIKQCDRYQNYRNLEMSEAKAMELMKKPVKMRVFAWNRLHYKDTVMSPIDSIKYMKLFLQAGFMAMNPETGEVKAWVGGIDHTFFQFDHVNLNTKRQVGSTIKALIYTFAVDNGYDPCGLVSTAAQEFPAFLKVPYDADHEKKWAEQVPMKEALAKSINNASLFMIKQVGIDAFVDFAHRCGISSRLDKVPAIALGAADISLYEMMGAYSMFPGKGINSQPFFISKIEDKNGMLIKSFASVQKEIINPTTAYKMVNLMRNVVASGGTGARMRFKYNVTADVAGKTGTTTNQADAWFIGYVPDLIAGVWVGCDDREFRFRSENKGQGAASALPIWAMFMKRVWADKNLGIDPKAVFKVPEGYNKCDTNDAFSNLMKGEKFEESPESGATPPVDSN